MATLSFQVKFNQKSKMRQSRSIAFLVLLFILMSTQTFADNINTVSAQTEKATFGMGCFWCSEAVFQDLKGVQKVQSGYEGGQTENPTYKDIDRKSVV